MAESNLPRQRSHEKKSKDSGFEVLHVNPKCKATVWEQILHESEKEINSLEEYKKKMYPKEDVPLTPPMEYMERKLLGLLRMAMESMLHRAIKTDSLVRYKSTFNGIDYLAEFLWNRNPKHPRRALKQANIFNMGWVKAHLHKHPREYFPLSWIYTREIAAGLIQRAYRGYLVRRRADVQEMRQFWKTLRDERPVREKSRKSVHLEISGDFSSSLRSQSSASKSRLSLI